jgi:hypothetical protein
MEFTINVHVFFHNVPCGDDPVLAARINKVTSDIKGSASALNEAVGAIATAINRKPKPQPRRNKK